MLRSGNTPLLRARKLEKLLNVGEIYIKLEGLNPSGHKNDRIAEVLVKDAIAHKQNIIIANGSQSYIGSLIYFAEAEDIEVRIPLFKNERWKSTKFKKENIMDLRNIKYASQIELLIEKAKDENAYLAAEGFTNTHISQMVLERLTDEIVGKLNYKVDDIWNQLGYAYTLTSSYNSLLKKWMDGSIEIFPTLYYGMCSKSVSEKISGENAMMDEKLLEETLQAATETNGEIIYVSDEELINGIKLLKKVENIKMSSREAYSFAAFYKLAKDKKIKSGKHVIVLDEGKSIVKIDNIKNYDLMSRADLVDFTLNCLGKYSDNKLETEEAIDNAMEKGYILLASRGGVFEGVCVIANLEFKEFLRKYHLAFIGTNKSSTGRGVGSELIQRAIDLTDGDISLHVEMENKVAKKIYEKYGFKHVYNRMIYHGEE
ncbi:MAG: pyridoxal-phosphate dependent enzyme [Eubacteriales bacterium]